MRKAIVIGGGFGGLAAAIRLQTQGFEVSLLEKRDKLGGRAYVYKDKGFTFDAGPTVITAPPCLEELFTGAGRKMEDYVELLPVNPLYRLYWEDGYRFDYTQDLAQTLAQIEKKSPQDVDGYREFLRYTEEVFEQGYTKLAHVPFLNWASMIRVSPQLIQLKAYRSVYAIVSKYIRDPQLRQAFSFHSLLVGGNPFDTSSIYTLIHFLERKWGVWFPNGGTGALICALEKLFLELGGKVEKQSEVQRIVLRDGKVAGVETKGAGFYPADAVVSNADVHRTYTRLLENEPAVRGTRWYLTKARYSMSLFVLYFGTNRRFPQVDHHNILFGARYKELLKEIFQGSEIPEDFSLYLHAPTHTDPSLAPEGCEAFYVLSPVPHLGNAKVDWKVEGPRYADRILEYLEERYLPGLRSSIVTQRIFTPLDFHDELGAHLGSAFSLEPVLRQSAYFRVNNRDPNVPGLYFAGAGTHPGAGIPGVVNSAKATAQLVQEDFPATALSPVANPPEIEVALERCREMIRLGSKSFSMASLFFPAEQRDAACFLYGWCRYCDDQIDETRNLRLQEERLQKLREETLAAFEGKPSENPVFVALAYVAAKYRIPSHYALELIEGMDMDVRKERYWTCEELGLYAYRVAGTVGLMMAHIMGASQEGALAHAASLGKAMQLTNIARDVLEDASRRRVYLPLSWMDEAGFEASQIEQVKNRPALTAVVGKLLDEAQKSYDFGNRGLRYLSWRCAFAVAAASCIYSEIGRRVRLRGTSAWDSRTVVPKWKKVLLLGRAAWMVLSTVPYRLARPFRPIELRNVWRHG